MNIDDIFIQRKEFCMLMRYFHACQRHRVNLFKHLRCQEVGIYSLTTVAITRACQERCRLHPPWLRVRIRRRRRNFYKIFVKFSCRTILILHISVSSGKFYVYTCELHYTCRRTRRIEIPLKLLRTTERKSQKEFFTFIFFK